MTRHGATPARRPSPASCRAAARAIDVTGSPPRLRAAARRLGAGTSQDGSRQHPHGQQPGDPPAERDAEVGRQVPAVPVPCRPRSPTGRDRVYRLSAQTGGSDAGQQPARERSAPAAGRPRSVESQRVAPRTRVPRNRGTAGAAPGPSPPRHRRTARMVAFRPRRWQSIGTPARCASPGHQCQSTRPGCQPVTRPMWTTRQVSRRSVDGPPDQREQRPAVGVRRSGRSP